MFRTFTFMLAVLAVAGAYVYSVAALRGYSVDNCSAVKATAKINNDWSTSLQALDVQELQTHDQPPSFYVWLRARERVFGVRQQALNAVATPGCK
jgi:hypothetical protein